MFNDRTRFNGIQLGKPFHVYIVNRTAEQADLSEFMIVTYTPSPSTCISHAKDDEPNILQISPRYQHKVTSFIWILLIVPFDISCMTAATSNRIATTSLNNQTKFWRPTGTKTLPYGTCILHIAANSLTAYTVRNPVGRTPWFYLGGTEPNRSWGDRYPNISLSPILQST